MIFHEIYGCYYKAVAKMIGQAIEGHLDEKRMNKIAIELAFEESMLTIVPALKEQKWQLIDHSFHTPIQKAPDMPLTTLEKRWLKTMLLDPRITLFQIPEDSVKSLADVKPLFTPDDVVYYDRYLDGDPYWDPEYVSCFHTVMEALRSRRKVLIEFISSRHKKRSGTFCPVAVEYSDKEDKFRVLCAGGKYIQVINIGRIIRCTLLDSRFDENVTLPPGRMEDLTFRLVDERNCLERVMMRFSHLEKQVEKTGDDQYLVHIRYDKDDTTDILIQLMSFGPYLTILEPKPLIEEYRKRLKKQLTLMDW